MDRANNRSVYLDIVRVTALFCVIMMHTGMEALTPGTVMGTALLQAVIVVIRVGIPLFFMASGALLLGREETFSSLFKHRILRFALVILLIQALQYWYMFRLEPWKIYLQYYLQTVYSGEFAAHTWYLYSYLAFLFMLPLLRRLVAGMERRHFYYLFVIYLLYMFASSLGDVIWGGAFPLNAEFSVSFFLAREAVVYPLLGYYLHNLAEIGERERTRGFAIACWGAGVAALALSVGMRMLSRRVTGSWQFDPYHYISIPAAAVFFGSRVACERHAPGRRFAALLATLSKTSFATYLLHNIWLDLFLPLKGAAASAVGPFTACLVHGLAALLFGTCVSFVLKKIPGLNKLL